MHAKHASKFRGGRALELGGLGERLLPLVDDGQAAVGLLCFVERFQGSLELGKPLPIVLDALDVVACRLYPVHHCVQGYVVIPAANISTFRLQETNLEFELWKKHCRYCMFNAGGQALLCAFFLI